MRPFTVFSHLLCFVLLFVDTDCLLYFTILPVFFLADCYCLSLRFLDSHFKLTENCVIGWLGILVTTLLEWMTATLIPHNSFTVNERYSLLESLMSIYSDLCLFKKKKISFSNKKVLTWSIWTLVQVTSFLPTGQPTIHLPHLSCRGGMNSTFCTLLPLSGENCTCRTHLKHKVHLFFTGCSNGTGFKQVFKVFITCFHISLPQTLTLQVFFGG